MSKEAADLYKEFLSEDPENERAPIEFYVEWVVDKIIDLREKLEKRGDKLAEQRVEAAGDLLEAISLWFYKRQGMEEPSWTEQYKSVCRLFEPDGE